MARLQRLRNGRGQWRQPRVPGCDSAGAAERSYLTPKVMGCSLEELPSPLRPGMAAKKSNHTSKEQCLPRRRRA